MTDQTTTDTMDALEKRTQQLVTETGEAPDRTIALDIDKMLRLGVLVDVDVHGAGQFTRRATWAELGVPEGDVRRARLKKGTKSLLPEKTAKRLKSAETKVRQNLASNGWLLMGFKPYTWIPFTAYEQWKTRHEELCAEINDIRVHILEHWDEYLTAFEDDFRTIALEAWDSVKARRGGNGNFALQTPGGAFDTPEGFAGYVISEAKNRFPRREDVENGLYVSYSSALITTGADVVAERAKMQAAQEKSKTARAKEFEARERERAQTSALERKLWDEERERDIKIAAMHQAEMEHARKAVEKTISPVEEVMIRLRAQMAKAVSEIAVSIQKNGYIRGKVAQRARGLMDTYNLLGSATGDDELEKVLVDLRRSLQPMPEAVGNKYDTQAVVDALTSVGAVTSEAAEQVKRGIHRKTRLSAIEF